MAAVFVHLSDIHFGQERGGRIHTHNDVKDRLVDDISTFLSKTYRKATGVIVTGDIAYSGKPKQYKEAGAWLDKIAIAAQCKNTDIQIMPGNHDIDRDEISSGAAYMLQEITEKGQASLDKFLDHKLDRESLYGRFKAYRPFAEGYDCTLDINGGVAFQRIHEIAPGRVLRFIGLNSAMICGKSDEEGSLLLGEKQRVLPINIGEELVVMSHHPLNWLQDSNDFLKFLRNRARVFMSGHEHVASINIHKVEDDCDLMMITAGAAVPDQASEGYMYTYNILSFVWDPKLHALEVTVHRRTWNDDLKAFSGDTTCKEGESSRHILRCANGQVSKSAIPLATALETPSASAVEMVSPAADLVSKQPDGTMLGKYPNILLRFFRDLSGGQRLTVLVKLAAIPEDSSDFLTHTTERKILDSLVRQGKIDEIEEAINKIQEKENKGVL